MNLLLASLLSTQIWTWDVTPSATSYRIIWAEMGGPWCKQNSLSFATHICSAGTCQAEIDLPNKSVFVLVTAINKYGEGPTGHGAIQICP